MLARLLRLSMLCTLLLGALAGWLLVWLTGIPTYWMSIVAFAMPVLTTMQVVAISCIRSRAPQSVHSSIEAARSRTDWWHALWGELLASVRVFQFQQPWAFSAPKLMPGHLAAQSVPDASGEPQAQPVPVLLVHGFVCNHRLWNRTAKRLVEAGHTVLTVDLEPVFTSIDRYAPIIEKAANTLCNHSGQARVALIGHSMGGLAIRAWMRAFGTGRVAQVITLGTPHNGTRVGDLRIGATMQPVNGLQMHWRSRWTELLAESETPDTRRLITTALSPQDNIVYPQREQTLPGSSVKVFDGLGHVQLCDDPGVLAWMLKQLAGTPASTATPQPALVPLS